MVGWTEGPGRRALVLARVRAGTKARHLFCGSGGLNRPRHLLAARARRRVPSDTGCGACAIWTDGQIARASRPAAGVGPRKYAGAFRAFQSPRRSEAENRALAGTAKRPAPASTPTRPLPSTPPVPVCMRELTPAAGRLALAIWPSSQFAKSSFQRPKGRAAMDAEVTRASTGSAQPDPQKRCRALAPARTRASTRASRHGPSVTNPQRPAPAAPWKRGSLPAK